MLIGLLRENWGVSSTLSGKRMLYVTDILTYLLFFIFWLLTGMLYWASVWSMVDSTLPLTLESPFEPQNGLETEPCIFERIPRSVLKLLAVDPKLGFLLYFVTLCENFLMSLLFFILLCSVCGNSISASKFSYLGCVIILRLKLCGVPPILLVSFLSQSGIWLSSWLKWRICCCSPLICVVIFA